MFISGHQPLVYLFFVLDHKNLMNRIEALLPQLLSYQRNVLTITSAQRTVTASSSVKASALAPTLEDVPSSDLVPIARIDEVSPGSPAETDGIKLGDLVLSIGSLHLSSDSTSNVSSNTPATIDTRSVFLQIPEIVKQSIGRPILLQVRRKEGHSYVHVRLTLVPKTWSGRGVLGCHFTPL
jgi:26S proteasome non-ATPase regulatory subunit 9